MNQPIQSAVTEAELRVRYNILRQRVLKGTANETDAAEAHELLESLRLFKDVRENP